MKDLIEAILSIFAGKEDLVLATVLNHKGSTPRDTGARCLIKKDGTLVGTIGGGLVEAKVLEAAKVVFAQQQAQLLDYDMTQQFYSKESMICGGQMQVVVEYLQPSQTNIDLFQTLANSYKAGDEAIFIIELSKSADQTYQLKHGLIGKEGLLAGDFDCSEETISAIRRHVSASGKITREIIGTHDLWIEPLVHAKRLFLLGAGHIARATAPLATGVGFATIVVDDRHEMLSRQYFQEQVRFVEVEQFDGCFQQLNVQREDFIVILTRGHALDKIVLGQAIRSSAHYIGLIGSRRKRNTIYGILKEEGITQEALDKVHSPIGIEIFAQTPEEIAISIVAELIKVRAGKQL